MNYSVKKSPVGFAILCVYLYLFSLPLFAQVTINEISACNIDRELDPEYDYRPWIELYNPTDEDHDLQHYYFSDDPLIPLKYKLKESRTIPSKGFALIWLNGEAANSGGATLDMSVDGGYLSVADASGTLVSSLEYPPQFTNISFGRTTDGGEEWGYFIETTCGTSNNGKRVGYELLATPELSQPSGFYNGSVTVTIQVTTPQATLHYTTDGSEPTVADPIYQSPLVFEETTVLRAKAFKDGYLEGHSISATYLINEREPDLPVVFLVTDTLNLYDDMIGIYCVGKNGTGTSLGVANYNQDWTRPAYFEYLDEQRKVQVSQLVGIGISGQSSRLNDQKSLKIKARKKYGNNLLAYDFLPNRPGRRYRSIVLRNGGQNNYYGGYRDSFLQQLTAGINVDYQDSQPVVLYINGTYWGYLNIRDRHNEDYVYSTYGIKEEDQYRIKFPTAMDADTRAAFQETFTTLAQLTHTSGKVEEEYQQIESMIDVDNALNYLSTEILCHNTDWPSNNQVLFKERTPQARWRWVLQDLDMSFELYREDRLWAILQGQDTEPSLLLFHYLLKNEKFKQRFIEKAALIAGSCYSPVRVNRIFGEKAALYTSERNYQVARWGGISPVLFKDNVNEFEELCVSFRDTMLLHINSYFNMNGIVPLTIHSNLTHVPVRFNGEEIPYLPFDGKYFKKRTLELAVPRYLSDKVFTHWTVTDTDGERTVTDTCLTLNLSKDTRVEAIYSKGEWKKRTGFYLNEVSASNAIYVDEEQKYEDWIEIYNSSTTSGNLAGYYLSNDPLDLTKWQVPTTDTLKTHVPAMEYLVIWCSKKPERGLLHASFKLPKEGGTLYLSQDINGKVQVVDSITYHPHGERESFGRYPDGGHSLAVFNYPTFQSRNLWTSYLEEVATDSYTLEQGTAATACYATLHGKGTLLVNGQTVSSSGTVSLEREQACTLEFLPDEGYRVTSARLNGAEITNQIRSGAYSIDKVYDDVFLEVTYEIIEVGKVVIGLSEASWIYNGAFLSNYEIYNNTTLYYRSDYADLPVYNTRSTRVMTQVKNIDTINEYLPEYGITEALAQAVPLNFTNLPAEESAYPEELFRNAWTFTSYVTRNPETRRSVILLRDVPNGWYSVRILPSLDSATPESDYSCFRYQVNRSSIYVPQEDIFYNNVDQFIEFPKVYVGNEMLLITSWRDPATTSVYSAPINLVEITQLKEYLSVETPAIPVNQYFSAIGHLVITGPVEKEFTIYTLEGYPVKTVSRQAGEWHEIPLPPGRYFVQGTLVPVF